MGYLSSTRGPGGTRGTDHAFQVDSRSSSFAISFSTAIVSSA
jgi:hypothetical protein